LRTRRADATLIFAAGTSLSAKICALRSENLRAIRVISVPFFYLCGYLGDDGRNAYPAGLSLFAAPLAAPHRRVRILRCACLMRVPVRI